MSQYKRYPEYKASGVEWLPKVPSHWTSIAIKRLARIENGRDYQEVYDEDGVVPIYGSGGQFSTSNTPLYVGESVLIGRKGTLDKPLHVNGAFWTVDTMFYTRLDSQTHGRYFYYNILNFPFDLYSTNTALPSLTQADIGDHVLSVPDTIEQTAIANFLDRETSKLDALIQEKSKFIELLEEKRQALISHAVTKGLDPNAPMKDSGVPWLGEVPEHWEVRRLRHLCSITTGSKDTVMSVEDGKYPFFVRSPIIRRINTYTFDGEGVLTSGDGAGVGKIYHYYVGKFDFHQRVYLFYQFRDVTGRFFYHYLASNFYKVALDGGAKSTVDSLRLPLIQNFELTVPTLDEQNQIVAYIDSQSEKHTKLIESTTRSIELLREKRSALITAAVTGQIDVRAEVA